MSLVKVAVSGTLNVTIADSAVPTGTNQYRVVARVATNAPGAGANLVLTGSVSVNIP